MLKQTRVPRFSLERSPGDLDPLVIDLGPAPEGHQRIAAITTVIRAFLDGAIQDGTWFLAQLQEQAEIPVNATARARELFMSLDQVKQLSASGMSIGSHSQSHHALASLDDAAQRFELTASKRFLENELGREIGALAYPFGWAGSFTGRTAELAGVVGYRLAFSALEGINRPGTSAFQPFAIRRLNVGTGDSAPLLRARAMLHTAFGKSLL